MIFYGGWQQHMSLRDSSDPENSFHLPRRNGRYLSELLRLRLCRSLAGVFNQSFAPAPRQNQPKQKSPALTKAVTRHLHKVVLSRAVFTGCPDCISGEDAGEGKVTRKWNRLGVMPGEFNRSHASKVPEGFIRPDAIKSSWRRRADRAGEMPGDMRPQQPITGREKIKCLFCLKNV